MSYTPVELRHVRVGRSLFGYNRATVEEVIEEVADSFETTWRERGELTDQVHALEKQIVELKTREDLLTHTLVAAEQAAKEIREHAKREAVVILSEAHAEARSIARAAQAERERLLGETRRIEALLRAALGMIQGSEDATPVPASSESSESSSDESLRGPWPVEAAEERRDALGGRDSMVRPALAEAAAAHNGDLLERQAVAGESRDFDWGD
jgi:cell division initiation protein